MTQIILDITISNQLHDLTHPVELCVVPPADKF